MCSQQYPVLIEAPHNFAVSSSKHQERAAAEAGGGGRDQVSGLISDL